MADDESTAKRDASDSAPDDEQPLGDGESADAATAGVEAETAEVAAGEDGSDSADSADSAEGDAADEGAETVAPAKRKISHVRLATIAGLVLVLGLGGLAGWLGYQAYQARKADDLRNLFIQVGRQGALNLTTIDWEQAEGDVQRILDSATGTFYDDFQQRAQPFVEVVKQAQSKSTGSINEAGLESQSGNEGRVLVAVTVNTTNLGAPEQQPRSWRMRITVEKVGDEAKVSNVEFVP
ncbi:Mce protein [Mycolicibacterium sp. XJ1819]